MMMLALVTAVLVSSALVAGDKCSVGDVDFTGFEPTKYEGTWYTVYRTPDPDESAYQGCEYDQYYPTEEGVSVLSVAYNSKENTFEASHGRVSQSTGNSFTISYSDDATWSSEFFVVDTDYETYSVVTGCPNDNSTPQVWVGSHSQVPSDETKEKVNSVLQKRGLSLDKLEAVDQSLCAKFAP